MPPCILHTGTQMLLELGCWRSAVTDPPPNTHTQVPEVEALKGRVMRALAAVPGDGDSLSSCVAAVLAHEAFWMRWKAGGSGGGSAGNADKCVPPLGCCMAVLSLADCCLATRLPAPTVSAAPQSAPCTWWPAASLLVSRRCLPFDNLRPKAEEAGLALPEQPPAKRRRVGVSGGGRGAPDAMLAEV
jgi:hypothetical protein